MLPVGLGNTWVVDRLCPKISPDTGIPLELHSSQNSFSQHAPNGCLNQLFILI